jgi:hypothetical protein
MPFTLDGGEIRQNVSLKIHKNLPRVRKRDFIQSFFPAMNLSAAQARMASEPLPTAKSLPFQGF